LHLVEHLLTQTSAWNFIAGTFNGVEMLYHKTTHPIFHRWEGGGSLYSWITI